MTRYVPFAAVALVVAGPLSSASAQPQPPVVQRPAFSPYLGLLSGFGNPGLNYLGVVRPTMQLQQQATQLQQQYQQAALGVQQLNANLTNALVYGIDPTQRTTGFIPTFNNTGHYFNSNPALRGVGGSSIGGYGGFGTGLQLPRPGVGYGGYGTPGFGGGGFMRPGGSALGTPRTAGSGIAPQR